MDVRHLAFMARQPSARVQPREHFWGLPKRGLALILANALFWQPLLANADGIVVSAPGTSLDAARNGVPVVNIAAPNGSGLSHNQFKDYNVGANGVILNNATDPIQSTQLGGPILGNPNLQGRAANIILNEVNGGSPSELRGATEVAGQSAKVIVANPYGISCNGCGFINTPNVTLTTGKPILDNGRLDRYQVDGGAVTIDGQGLNASDVDRFEIITRSAKINGQINGQINARNLTVIVGRNDVNAQTLNATARADDGSAKPELAIDSSALGGMYAGAIKLVGTEAGVGVKLDGTLIASGGDIQLDANGQLKMAQAKAETGAINIKAASVQTQGRVHAGTTLDVQSTGDLNNQNELSARDRITLTSGGQLTNSGIVESGVNLDLSRNTTGDLNLSAQSINNTAGSLVASRNLTVDATQALNNQGGTLSAKQVANISAGTLDNQSKGRVLSTGSLTLNASQLLNAQGGLVNSSGPLSATVGQLNNRSGEVSSLGTAMLNIATLDNVAGLVTAGNALSLTASGAVNNLGGKLTSQGTLNLKADAVDNSAGGQITSNQTLTANVASLNNNAGQLAGVKSLTLDVNKGQLNNQGGLIRGSTLVLSNLADVGNQSGEISSAQGFTFTAKSLDNTGGKLLSDQALNVRLDQALINVKGLISANGLDARAASLNNSGGTFTSKAGLLLNLDGALTNTQGEVSSASSTEVHAASLDNSGGKVSSGQGLTLTHSGDVNNTNGLLISEGTLTATTAGLNNTSGKVSSTGAIALTATGAMINQNGAVTTAQGLTLNSASLDNRNGTLNAKGAVGVTTGAFDNTQAGSLISKDTLTLTAAQVSNGVDSRITSDNALTASVTGFDQQGGKLTSVTSLSLDLNNGQLNNQQGLINAPLLMLKNLNGVNNQSGEISSVQAFTLASKSLDNSSGKLITNQALTLRVEQVLSNIKGLVSAAVLQVHSTSLDNSEGMISSQGTLGITVDGVLKNQGGTLVSEASGQLAAASLENNDGEISSKGDLTANITNITNQNGTLIAQGALFLEGLTLDNQQKGFVSATQKTSVNVGKVNNRGGEISSGAGVQMTGQSLDNSDSGLVLAATDLKLNVDNVLNRNKGKLSGQSGASLTGASLDNSGGSLISQKDLDLKLNGELNNNQGRLSSEGILTVNAVSLSNRQGNVSSAGALNVAITGAVDNQGGELVTDAGLILSSASLDNSQKGTLSSTSALNITTGAFDNSHAGNVSTFDTLNIAAGQLTNQDGGRLTSNKALTAKVTGLDQQGGKLVSKTSVALDLNHGQLNNQGGLINGPLLMLKNLKGVNNQSGEISSAQAFTLTADSLDNSSGQLLSYQALTLRIAQALNNVKGLIAGQSIDGQAASLDNSGGTLSSRGDTLLNIDGQLNNQNKGLINGDDTLTLNSTGLDNQSGSLQGKSIAIDLGSATGDLNNNAGLITTDGQLTIKHLRDLSNQSGEISTAQNLTLSGRTLDNSAGKLISNNLLTLGGNQLVNQGGLISGWQGVSIGGADLDNRNQGTVSSRYGNVDATLSNSLLNSGAGALVSQKALTVNAASLDNSGGILIGNDAVTLDLLGALTNTNGMLASAGTLLVKRATEINNQGGQLASQGQLTLFAGSLDNRNRGTVAANGAVTIATTGAVQNSGDGLIYSQNADLKLKAASLDNAKGSIQSQAALNLDISGDLDNQSGKVIAKAGDVNITAATIDNRGGTLASLKGALQAKALGGLLRNDFDLNNNRQAGIIQAQSVILVSASLNNNGGRIAAQSGDTVVTTGAFDNRDGGLYAKSAVKVSGSSFDNSGDVRGQVAGGEIDLDLSGALNNQKGIIESDSTLNVVAGSVDNQGGQLRALGKNGKTDFQIGGLFDNRSGALETANSDLTLNAGSFQNVGGSVLHVGAGTFDISTTNLTNAGGSVVTRGGLTLTADNWTNSSVIQAGRLTVNVKTLNQTAGGQLLASDSLIGEGGNWSNDGLIASDGSLKLTLGGTYRGSGRASSLGDLSLTATQVNLNNTASIASGGNVTANITGGLSNYGRLTAATDLNLTAGAINNYGTLGSNQKLTVTTGALVNDHALIFSGADMSLRVDSLNNSYADIYSLGNLSIDRDGKGGLATSIINSSSTIQSDGNLSLAASTIKNQRSVLTTNDGGIYTASITEFPCQEAPNYAGDCSGKQNHLWQIVQRDKFDVTEASAASSISAGQNLTITGGDLLNASSSIGTAGSLNITVNNLANNGIETGETETWRLFVSERTRNASGWYSAAAAFNKRYSSTGAAYNPKDLSGLEAAMASFIGMTEQERAVLRRVMKIDAGDQRYAAVIQAAGAVTVKAQANIDSRVVRPGFNYVGAGAKTNTDSSGASAASGFSTRITVNQQLPPDLAQQQVNPLSLPGFSLPTGQNGLFRLSGQGAARPTNHGPQSWVMGGASIDTAQRAQALPTRGGRTVLVRDAAQTAVTTRAPVQTADLAANVSGSATALNVAPVVDPGTSATLPGRSNTGGVTSVAPVEGLATSAGSLTVNRVQGLPDSNYVSNPQKYLIETNPALTDLKQFMGSDYLLSKLGYNPDNSWKRLGDGLYEDRLIQQAVIARTGQRFLDGQFSDAGQYKYLMDNAIASKQQLNLSVGVSLTSEQVAALTHDIVWMETAAVNGEQVLVPVLYLAQANNRLGPNGALIAGNDVNLIAGENLNNVGTLRATNNLSASAGANLVNSGLIEAGNRLDLLAGNNLINKAGGIIAGRDVSLTAVNGDVINERTVTSHQSSSGYRTERSDYVDNAARIEAANNLSLQAGRDVNGVGGVLKSGADTNIKAGRDVNLVSAEQRNANAVTDMSRGSGVFQYGNVIEAGRDFRVQAGRDIRAIASQIDAKRDVAMAATRDLTLASGENEQHSSLNTKKVKKQEDHVQQVGTSLVAGGDIALSAGKDLALIASRVSAGKEAYLYAGRDLDLNAAQNNDYSYYRKTKTSSSGFSSTQKTRIDSSSSTTQQGSSVSADTVVVRAGQDIGTSASDIVSTNGTSLIAGRNVVIDGATETFEQSHSSSTKKSGLLSSGGIGFTLGSTSNQNTSTSSTETTRASNVGSVLGSVNIEAKDLTVRGSDVVAGQDIRLVGQNVNILADENNNRSEQTSKSKSGGLTLALSGTVGSAVDSTYQTAKQAKNEDDSRLSALQGVKAGLTGVQAWQAAQQNGGMTGDNAGQFVGIAISLGSQKSSSKQTQEQTVSQGSSLTSGNNLTIVAAGNGTPGADGDIRIQGSKLQAGNEMSLAAERDIRLEAAANTQKLDGKNSSSGGAIGASIGVGSNGAGLSIFANANKGTGSEKGNGTAWTETTLDSGKQVSLISGRDTALKGAQVSADNITANVGRDLTLQSLQDTDDYKSKQTNVSGGASFTFGTMTGSGSLSVNKSKIDSKYESVQEQTGLFSGKGGYQVDVKNHTQLDGSVIASTADADKNRLSTGTLGWSDIKNKADYTSKLQNASVSSGNNGVDGFVSNMPSGTLIAFNHGDSASGTTSSAISKGTLDIRDPDTQQQDVATLSHDVEHANDSISPIFDKEKEQKRLRQVQLIGDIGTQAVDIVRTQGQIDADKAARAELDKRGIKSPGKDASEKDVEAYKQKLIATDAYKRIMEDYGVGGNYPRVAQAVTAALQGLVGGDIGSALTGASAPYLAQVIKKTTGDNTALNTMAHAVLGAVVAQAQGNSALAGGAGAATGEFIAHQLYPGIKTSDLTQEQKETVVALSGLAAGLAGGIAGGDLGGAVAGANAGRNAVENNAISDIAEASAAGKTQAQLAEERVKAENEHYKEQNCAGMSAQACSAQMYDERRKTLAYTVAGGAVVAGAVAGAMLLGPALLNSCGMNPVVCTELTLAAVEVPFGAATAGGAALGMGGFGSLAAKEVAATADAAAAARNTQGTKEIQAGAGGTWNVLDEIASPNVVKQSTPTACGAACGEMLLKDRGVLTSQVDLGTELTSMNSLARKLNTVDSGWVGNAVDVSSFNALNKTGSWSAMMWDSGNKVGHWVVVDGVDDVGRVLIKDPFNGTQYKMGVEEFKDVWNGHSVYKQ